MKIGIIAGTPVDSKFGYDILTESGYKNLISVSVSKNPIEQTIFQTSSINYKENIISELIKNLLQQGCEVLFIYCNSLSSSLDFEKLSYIFDIKIITPLQVYKELASKYSNIAILAANAQGLAGIEKVMLERNQQLRIVGITLLEMVNLIEKNIDAEKIAKKINFEKLLNYINSNNVEKIILGCTHFPYIEKELRKYTAIDILNPINYMLEKL